MIRCGANARRRATVRARARARARVRVSNMFNALLVILTNV